LARKENMFLVYCLFQLKQKFVRVDVVHQLALECDFFGEKKVPFSIRSVFFPPSHFPFIQFLFFSVVLSHAYIIIYK